MSRKFSDMLVLASSISADELAKHSKKKPLTDEEFYSLVKTIRIKDDEIHGYDESTRKVGNSFAY